MSLKSIAWKDLWHMVQSGVQTLGRRLGLGIVGGGIGSFIGETHRMAAQISGRFDLVAGAFDIDPERGKELGRERLLSPERVYDTYLEMAEREAAREDRVDVVSIMTPNNTHHEIARAFIDRGFHVICEKPMTTTLADALDLVQAVGVSGTEFGVMHGYTGYPMVRQARAMVEQGELGALRLLQLEFAIGLPGTLVEDPSGHWRTRREFAGPSSVLPMIGTHARHLASYVSGLDLVELAAELTTYVPGRELDDNAHLLLRFADGVRGTMWLSYVAAGYHNNVRIRVFGELGGLEWQHEYPNHLTHFLPGAARRTLSRGEDGLSPAAGRATRIAIGMSEGFIESFSTIYSDIAEVVFARLGNREPDPLALTVPGVEDGALGVKFVEAAIESNARNGAWVDAQLQF